MRCKQAPPVRVSRSGGSQRESNWEHAEVAKRRRDAKERERKCRTEEREREKKKKKKNRERVRDESKMERK